ncbi:MAG: hypothetical protein JW849_10360 [Phycisphaerae bacterium]|nr:hypothetical protein [Phycisphaerae bacterium]
MNETLRNLIVGLSRQSVQIAAVFLIVVAAAWLLRRRSAHWRYMLWLVVLVKCLTPPAVFVPLALLPASTAPAPVPHVPATNGEAPAVSSIVPKWTAVKPSVEDKGTQHPGTAHSRKPIASIEPVAPVSAAQAAGPSPAVHPSTISRAFFTWGPWEWAGLAWFVGAAGFGIYVLVRGLRIRTQLRRLRRPVSDSLQQEIKALAQTMGLKRDPKAWLVETYSQPFVWGLWRGSLYLPADFGEISFEARRQILAHELAHVVRCDAAVNAVQILAQGLFFFHPLVWWANRQLRREREKCCDEMAIATRIVQPRQYTSAIVDTLLRNCQPECPQSSLAVAGPVKNLEDRIKTILTPGREFFRRPTRSAILTVLLLAVVVAPTALTLTAKAQISDASAPQKQSSNLMVTLPTGVTVELVAVSQYPCKPNGWWRPNGEPITDTMEMTGVKDVNVPDGWEAYAFLYRVVDKKNLNVSTCLKLDNSHSQDGLRVPGNEELQGFVVTIPKGRDPLSLKIGVAAGNWKTETAFPPNTSGGHSHGDVGFMFSEAIQSGTDLIVTFSDNLKGTWNRRIVAIDKKGKRHTPGRFGMHSAGNLHQSSATLMNLKKDDVKEFQFQTRPYEWVMFRIISLAPGKEQFVIAGCLKKEKSKLSLQNPSVTLPAGVTSAMEEQASVQNKLRRRIPKIELSGVRFEDAIAYLREVSHLNIFVNYGQINREYYTRHDMGVPEANRRGGLFDERSGSSRTPSGRIRPTRRRTTPRAGEKIKNCRDAQVSVNLTDVTIEDALRRVLDSAGGDLGIQLGYAVDGLMVVVSTPDDIVEMTSRPSASDGSERTDEEKNTWRRLQKKIPKIELVNVRVADSIEFLREISNVNLFVNYGQIDEACRVAEMAVDSRDVQITVYLEDVSVEDALRRILNAAGGEMGIYLGYAIDGSTVVVTTRQGIGGMAPRISSTKSPAAPGDSPTAAPGSASALAGSRSAVSAGSASNSRAISIRAPVDGIVAEVCSKSNRREISKGEVLVRMDTSELTLELRRRQVKYDLARKKFVWMEKAARENAVPDENVSTARADMELAELDLEEIRLKIAKAKIVSPGNGRVIETATIHAGTPVRAGDLLLTVALEEEEPKESPAEKHPKDKKSEK